MHQLLTDNMITTEGWYYYPNATTESGDVKVTVVLNIYLLIILCILI